MEALFLDDVLQISMFYYTCSINGISSPEQNPAENLSHKPPWYTSMLNYVF